MKKICKNYAFIDIQNLHINLKILGWAIDYRRLRKYLEDKYSISKAFIFVGYLPKEEKLYTFLKQAGFILIFKEVHELPDGTVKGNCDGELILQAMIEFHNYNKALLITGDGDFVCLIKYLDKNGKLLHLIAPSRMSCSRLITKSFNKNLSFFTDLYHKLAYKKKPDKDKTL